MKTALRAMLALLLLPVIVFLAITAALYIPPVQDWAVNTASRYATQGTGLNVSVGRVGLTFPLDIDMRRVVATNDSGDTILCLDRTVVDLDLGNIFTRQLGIDRLSLQHGTAHTHDLIEGLRIDGSIDQLSVTAPNGIDLALCRAHVGSVALDGCDLTLTLGDMPTDTTASTPLPWHIYVRDIGISATTLCLATDSLWARATIDRAEAGRAVCDLAAESYSLATLALKGEAAVCMPALSPDTLSITPIDIEAHDAGYTPHDIRLGSLAATIMHSCLSLSASAEIEAATAKLPQASAEIEAAAAQQTQAPAVIDTGTQFDRHGNINNKHKHINQPTRQHKSANTATQELPTPYAEGEAPAQSGLALRHYRGNLTASIDRRDILWGCAAIGTDTVRLSRMLPQLCLDCEARAQDGDIQGTAHLVMGGRKVATAEGGYNLSSESYSARLHFDRLAPRAFVRTLPIGPVTANIAVQGQGLDPYSPATTMTARAELKRCMVDSIDLRDVCLAASYRQRKASLLLDCNNSLVDGNLGLAAIVKGRDDVQAQFSLDINKVDLYGLRVTKVPLTLAAAMHIDGTSDLRSRHSVNGTIGDIALLTTDTVFRPKDIILDALVHSDTLAAHISAGDLTLGFTAGCGTDELTRKASNFVSALGEQLAQYHLDQEQLRTMLPRAEVSISMGSDNPAAHVAQVMGYTIDGFRVRLGADPTVGLNGGVMLKTLGMGAVTLDEMWCNIYQDTTGVKMDARIHNGPKNPHISFDARASAYILPSGAGLNVTYTDDRGRKAVDVGTQVDILPDGIRMHLTPLTPIVANRRFDVNRDNYVFMAPDGRVSANLELTADDGTGMKLYSAPEDTTAQADTTLLAKEMPRTLQDLTLSMHNVNVAELCNVMPYMPRLAGMMYGDVHLVQTTQTLSVAVDAGVDALSYEGAAIGDMMLNATYLPVGDSCHYVDGLLMLGGDEVMALSGNYTDGDNGGSIEAEATLAHLPLAIIGNLAGDPNTLALGGDMDGTVTVSGPPSQPRIDGHIATDGVTIASPAYNVSLRVRDDTVSISDNRLMLNGIDIYSTGRRPLTVDGTIDFGNPSDVRLDTRLSAKRFELINAKRTATSVAYGKVLVDADATLRGTLSRLSMQGRLGVLGGTDVTYILQDSPLTVEDRLADLVTFVDFNDTIPHEAAPEAQPMALTMNMAVSVDESTQVHCLLSPDRSSYIELEGGGELMLGYSPQGDISMTGRYTIISGEMKYALPVIPLKTFSLQNGSYVAWNGKMLNPSLDIKAVERTRAAVSSETGANRSVTFDVGVAITQTLENMGLAFTIEAPEDAAIQNELLAMDDAARGRVAVTMLATGMYITDTGSSGGFSTTNALGSFLQSEISNIAGKALGSLDVNVGVEEGTGRTGGQTTDYSFSFAKRFWNNRISVSFGGRVSSGADAQNTGATIIDNVAIEYRLDQSATRYVRLSYDKNYESLLEGTITEMGAGLVLRRKTTRLGELFIFRRKKKKEAPPQSPPGGGA